MKTKLMILASALLISSAAHALDDDSLPKAQTIPYTEAQKAERDPFQLPREARNSKSMVKELNRTAMAKQKDLDMNAIEPAAGK